MHSLAHAYVHSADTRHCTRIPFKIHSVDTGHPLAVNSLLHSGTTGMFIDAGFVRAEKLRTWPLPRAILVYNIDGTPNELGSIKEEVNLICTYGDHTERATFLVTSLGSLYIILGHTWIVKHNPDVNWRTGQVKMTRCPESCGVKPIDRRPSVETVCHDLIILISDWYLPITYHFRKITLRNHLRTTHLPSHPKTLIHNTTQNIT